MTEKVSGYGFNGEYYDAATGMLNLRARQYEPAQARFSQRDIENGNVANARSQNAYLYCYNDGVNYFDADGAKPEAVRNNTTVDPGGSSVSRKQNSAPKTSSKFIPSAKEFSAAIAKGFSDPLWVQATGGGSTAISAGQREYAAKQKNALTVNSAISRYLCTAVSKGFGWLLWTQMLGMSEDDDSSTGIPQITLTWEELSKSSSKKTDSDNVLDEFLTAYRNTYGRDFYEEHIEEKMVIKPLLKDQ